MRRREASDAVDAVVKTWAARLPANIELDDLRQEARIGIWKHESKHGPQEWGRRIQVATCAVIDYLRRDGPLSRKHWASVKAGDAAFGTESIDDVFGLADQSPGWEYEQSMLELYRALDKLTQREADIVTAEAGSMSAVGRQHGISPARAHQIKGEAMDKLRRMMVGHED